MYLLPANIVTQIKEFINVKTREDQIRNKYPNPLLREDIFSILDMYCKVIYFPLPEETINGFHITGMVDSNGEDITFVYINTSQTIEKQVFTAAHELGHIWEVDKLSAVGQDDSFLKEHGENIINRFAAELLMPEDLFVSAVLSEFIAHKESDGSITLPNTIKLIARLMACFFVPYKAVVHRMFELFIISEESASLLMGKLDVPLDEFVKLVNKNLRDMGCVNFLETKEKRWIDGLSDLLDQAEEQHSVSEDKINNLRELFGLSKSSQISNSLHKKLNISLEGTTCNDRP